MTEIGKVINVVGDKATVRFHRRSECDKCLICAASKDGRHSDLSLPNILDACENDYVEVEIYRRRVRLASVALYFIPLALTALGAGLGTLMSIGASVILAIAGFVAGLAFALPIDICVIRKKDGFAPRMLNMSSEAAYIARNSGSKDE